MGLREAMTTSISTASVSAPVLRRPLSFLSSARG